jgi:general secretion pathway protein D
MKPTCLSLTLAALLSAAAWSQQPQKPEPIALPERIAPDAPLPGLAPPPEPAKAGEPQPAAATPAQPATPLAKTAPALAKPIEVTTKGNIVMNFQGASLTDVLNHLSEAAGFIIVQEEPVKGTITVVSKQALGPEEAVDLLNAVLIEKGFVAIRNGRILKIVKRTGAEKRDLPVQLGSDPEMIPRKDAMVTQILPLRYGEAAKLVENLRPLLPENATITANDSSNSILMTDTQTNIRRMAEIIKAVDTSVSAISTLHVYPLKYADAKELATVISQLFVSDSSSSRNRNRGGGGGFPFPFPGGGDRGGSRDSSEQSEARKANSRIIAVADEQSNSLIVSAPAEDIPTITELVEKIDTSISDVTETQIFRLQHADATELAQLITNLYSETGNQQNGQNRNRNEGRGPGGFFGFGGDRGGDRSRNSSNDQSQRALLQSKVVAVGDPRTNSLVVTAARDTMFQIAQTVGRLDATDAKKQRVYVYSLEHVDPDSVANVLRGMLGDQTATNTNAQNGASRLSERSATGAAMDANQIFNSNNNNSRGGR